MKIKIERGSKDGKFFFTVRIKDHKYSKYELDKASEFLTGAKNGVGSGIFKPYMHQRFYYGDFSKDFEFNEIDLMNDPLNKIKEELINRIRAVRKWVKSIDHTETIEFEI